MLRWVRSHCSIPLFFCIVPFLSRMSRLYSPVILFKQTRKHESILYGQFYMKAEAASLFPSFGQVCKKYILPYFCFLYIYLGVRIYAKHLLYNGLKGKSKTSFSVLFILCKFYVTRSSYHRMQGKKNIACVYEKGALVCYQ